MDSLYPRMDGQIDDVASAADRLADVCQMLETRLNDAELSVITLRRQFATWVLRSLEASESRQTSDFGPMDSEVLTLVRRYLDYRTGECSNCRHLAPLTDDGRCVWRCSQRSPASMAP